MRRNHVSLVVGTLLATVLLPGSAAAAGAADGRDMVRPSARSAVPAEQPGSSGFAGSAGSGAPSGSAGSGTPRSRYRLPVPGPPHILTAFRPPAERWGAGHRGVDLATTAGTQVRAAGDGVVAFAGMLAGRPVVSVRHTATLRTTYEPVLPTVRVGQTVVAGQPIGTLRAGHPSCRPADCLHWGARLGADHYLDPMALLGGLRVRLKPWTG